MKVDEDYIRQITEIAYRAGLAGEPLPTVGRKLLPEELRAVNNAYDDARNRHAAKPHEKKKK